jgi:hypothetical protein
MSKAADIDRVPSATYGGLNVVVFVVAGQRCAVEASHVRRARPLRAEDGNYPRMAPLLGFAEPHDIPPWQVLTIRTRQGDAEYIVSTPVELRQLETGVIHPLPDIVAARTELRGLRALALEADGVTLIFDIRDLPVPS